jgi:hypothetical protein
VRTAGIWGEKSRAFFRDAEDMKPDGAVGGFGFVGGATMTTRTPALRITDGSMLMIVRIRSNRRKVKRRLHDDCISGDTATTGSMKATKE